ncbi:Cupredoxin [Mytilinidion resinicola]|uniref:Cupredoxin n=1 Tax=Mytilinidion resinicola TaxID=574789 RepID=A0A6A6YIG6_9PEZI|nr:Cupredoxin [Mytilinidion resinicola]KAF2808591.1 Cupredoxin [Mytilinidion resinicola]
MTSLRCLALAAVLAGTSFAGDDQWLSPVYKAFYQYSLPLPPVKTPKTLYVNQTTGAVIDYYEVDIKPLEQQDGISPGPTFHMERGREAVVRFINHGDLANSVHLHGSYSRAPFDGWAEDTTQKGQYKDYCEFANLKQNARNLWYHDHAVHHTAENAYFGQARFYILHDPAEDSLGLPAGNYDIALALAAKQYNSDGTLFSPTSETLSLYGDVIHVNGQPWPYFKVEPRNRAFQLWVEADGALGTKIPFQMIGSDAGLLSKPITSDLLHISMAERKNITLRNNRKVQADEDYNSTDKVMKFVVGNTVTSQQGNGNVPSPLREVPFPPLKSGVDRNSRFERSNGEWQINGVTFSEVENRIPVRVIARYAPWDGVYMFHCHNLIHEDHDMMAAFNVSVLADFGYPETTHFIDPMEQRSRSTDITDGAFEEEHIQDRINELYLIDAYKDIDKVEEALVSYWDNHSSAVPSTLQTSVKSIKSTTAQASTTTAARVTTKATTTTKNDEKKTTKTAKTTTKK